MWKQKKNNRVNKIELNTLRSYTTLYHTYKLLYCKRHIQKTSICNVNVEKEKNNKLYKMTTLNSIQLEIILHYITLTNYYIVKDTLR